MRVAFGLVGILVTLGVVVLIMKYFYLPSAQQAIDVQKQVETSNFTGRAEDGTPIGDTYKLYPDQNSMGKVIDFQVVKINPGSPMSSFFGLQENDVILAAVANGVNQKVSDQPDEESARNCIDDAYTHSGQLIVQRGDQTFTLPMAAVAQNKPATPTANPSLPPTQTAKPAQAQKQQQPQDDGGQNDTMDEIHQRLHALPTY